MIFQVHDVRGYAIASLGNDQRCSLQARMVIVARGELELIPDKVISEVGKRAFSGVGIYGGHAVAFACAEWYRRIRRFIRVGRRGYACSNFRPVQSSATVIRACRTV